MSNKLFARNRIRGVSFRRGHASSTPHTPGKRAARTPSHFGLAATQPFNLGWSGPSVHEIRASAPVALEKHDLRRLLEDYGRNELHTLVSEAVEQLSRLRQLNQSIRAFSSDSEPDRHFLRLETAEDITADPIQELGIELQWVQRLWNLRLEILEMIAMAQDSLRNLHARPAKKPPQPGARSAPRPK